MAASEPASFSQNERLFPTLTSAQIDRLAAHGTRRTVASGDVLVEPGQKVVPFFVVVRGAVQVFSPAAGGKTPIVTHTPCQFSLAANMITGRRSMAQLRVGESGEVIE